MELENMKVIIEAEQQAEQIKEKAKSTIITLKSQSEKDRETNWQRVEKEIEREKKEIVHKAVDESQNKVDSIIEKAKEECTKIEKQAKVKQEQAIDCVIKKVGMQSGSC